MIVYILILNLFNDINVYNLFIDLGRLKIVCLLNKRDLHCFIYKGNTFRFEAGTCMHRQQIT